jgi:hypothetical protein
MVQKLIEILNKQLKPIFKKCGEFSIKRENILGVVFKDDEIQIIELSKKKVRGLQKVIPTNKLQE